MVYVVGVIGFFGGFALGLMVLSFLLRNVKSEDLLNDRFLKWKYGLLNWMFAGLGCYCSVYSYKYYFM
jgi:intracellular septation protein A